MIPEAAVEAAVAAGMRGWDARTAVEAYVADPDGADGGRIASIISKNGGAK